MMTGSQADQLLERFPDPPNVAVVTTSSILSGHASIRLVTHEAEDGAWQFLTGEVLDNEEIRVVALRRVVQLDESIAAVADLPLGWLATRASITEGWTRSPIGEA